MPTSVYAPLALDEIRLLYVDPATHDSPLVCSLETVKLLAADPVFYETISYCWGSVETTQIVIDGAYCDVPGNAAKVLRHFRCGPYEEQRILWIDAVCINQADIEERSHQVCSNRSSR